MALFFATFVRFYYPHGKPTLTVASDRTLQRILTALDAFPNRQPDRESFGEVVEACGYPRYWRMPLFSCAQLTAGGPADGKRFIDFWKECVYFGADLVYFGVDLLL